MPRRATYAPNGQRTPSQSRRENMSAPPMHKPMKPMMKPKKMKGMK